LDYPSMSKFGTWIHVFAIFVVLCSYVGLRGTDSGCLVTGSGIGLDGFYAAQSLSTSDRGATVWVRSDLELARIPNWLELTKLPANGHSRASGSFRIRLTNDASYIRLEMWTDNQPTFVLRNEQGKVLFVAAPSGSSLQPQPLTDNNHNSPLDSGREPSSEALFDAFLHQDTQNRRASPPTSGWHRVFHHSGAEKDFRLEPSTLKVGSCSPPLPPHPTASTSIKHSKTAAIVNGVPVGGRGGNGGLWAGGGGSGGLSMLRQIPATGLLIIVNLGVSLANNL